MDLKLPNSKFLKEEAKIEQANLSTPNYKIINQPKIAQKSSKTSSNSKKQANNLNGKAFNSPGIDFISYCT